MAEFTFEAMAPTGQRSQGTLTATSEREAMSILDARGLFPLAIQPVREAGAGIRFAFRIGGRHMATFYAELADLLKAGVPLLRSLDILERQTSHKGLKPILRDV